MDNTVTQIVGAIGVLALVLGYAYLVIGALVSIVKSRMEGGMKLVWCVFVFVAPFLGSLAWFWVGRKSAEARR
jgi:hypothetical protein